MRNLRLTRCGGSQGAGPGRIARLTAMASGADPYNLQRFVKAQEPVYVGALAELRAGHKREHWMWFIFPQIEGLAESATSEWFAIHSLDEARAFLEHPVLGPRIRECAQAILDVEGRSIDQIFGYPDNLKFRSSMTLFARAARQNDLFMAVLEKYCGGMLDPRTIERL